MDEAIVLATLSVIDMVVIFEEDTPIELIKKIKPSVHVKGGDYEPESLPEYDVVTNYGGKVVIEAFYDGCYTTSTIKKAPMTLHIYTKIVTDFQQNARVLIDDHSKKAIIIDPGGDVELI